MSSTRLSPLNAPAVRSIAEAIHRMESIQAALDPGDGLRFFNLVYLEVTRAVKQRIRRSFFENAAFMTSLDVTFANLYFSALRLQIRDPQRVPRAWAVLLDHRMDEHIMQVQYALAGINAHINRDLPHGLVTTWTKFHTTPDAGSHRRDYDKVSSLLAEIEPSVRSQLTEHLALGSRELEHLENILANWSIVRAREAAWEQGELFWRLGGISCGPGRRRKCLMASLLSRAVGCSYHSYKSCPTIRHTGSAVKQSPAVEV